MGTNRIYNAQRTYLFTTAPVCLLEYFCYTHGVHGHFSGPSLMTSILQIPNLPSCFRFRPQPRRVGVRNTRYVI